MDRSQKRPHEYRDGGSRLSHTSQKTPAELIEHIFGRKTRPDEIAAIEFLTYGYQYTIDRTGDASNWRKKGLVQKSKHMPLPERSEVLVSGLSQRPLESECSIADIGSTAHIGALT